MVDAGEYSGGQDCQDANEFGDFPDHDSDLRPKHTS